MNNKILGILFLGLLLTFGITKFFSGNKDRSFDPDILKVDNAAITKLEIAQKDQEAFTFEKNGALWVGKKGNLEITPKPNSVESTIQLLGDLKVLRIASRDAKKWKTYEVDEETSKARIKVFAGSKLIKDYIVGGFRINQQERSAKSFLRLGGENEVYVLDGFSSMSLGQGFDSYRDRKIVALDAAAIAGLSWTSTALNQRVEKTAAGWQGNDGELLDSLKMLNLMTNLTNLNAIGFIDNYAATQETGNTCSISIQASNQTSPINLSIKEITGAEHSLVLISSANPATYFAVDSATVINQFFKPLSEFQ